MQLEEALRDAPVLIMNLKRNLKINWAASVLKIKKHSKMNGVYFSKHG